MQRCHRSPGVRHSKPVTELRDVSVQPLDGSATEAEDRNESRNNAAHNNTSATSGCSSLHDVTNVSREPWESSAETIPNLRAFPP